MEYQKLTKIRLADKVVEVIYDQITKGELKPGDRLPTELDLSEQLGVARTTVREAFSQLMGLGLIERSEYGMFIPKEPTTSIQSRLTPLLLKDWETKKLYESRRVIEGELAVLAAAKATAKDFEQLKKINAQMLTEHDTEMSYFEKDAAFHDTVAQLADNEILYTMRSIITNLFNKYEKSVMELEDIKKATHQWHADLIEAMEQQNISRVRQIVNESLDASEKALLALHKTARSKQRKEVEDKK